MGTSRVKGSTRYQMHVPTPNLFASGNSAGSGASFVTRHKRKREIQSSLEKAISEHQTPLVAWCCPFQV